MEETRRVLKTHREMLNNLEGYFREILNVSSKDGRRTLEVLSIELPEIPKGDDFDAQKRARSLGITLSKKIYGKLRLRQDGKIKEEKRIALLDVPEVTMRGTYVVDGTEYTFPIQKRLLPGVYTTRKPDGTIASWINSGKGRSYTIRMTQKGIFFLEIKAQTKVYKANLLAVLLGLGIPDGEIARSWGREIYEINAKASGASDVTGALKTVYEGLKYEQDKPASTEDVSGYRGWLLDYFANKSELDADNTSITTGIKTTTITPQLLVQCANQALAVYREEREEDNKESLVHNQFMDIGDFGIERLNDRAYRSSIKSSITRGLNDPKAPIEKIVNKGTFQEKFKSVFTQTSLARSPKQTNPMDMMSNFTEVTIRGEGGIQTDQAVTKDVRALDPSHLGFFDPLQTPEGGNIGTTLHLSIGAEKQGRDLVTTVTDVKTGKDVKLNPREFYQHPVAYVESWDAKTKKIKPDADGLVSVMWKHEDQKVKPSEVRYVLRSFTDMVSTNVLSTPFVSHSNGTRIMTGSKMSSQAKPLKYREAPLVQCAISETSNETVEAAVAKNFSPVSPVDGHVTKIEDTKIQIEATDGTKHTVQVPKKFWLNEGNFVDSEITVKTGDKIKKGQSLADTNYTKGGQLALGVNLNIAYIPYKGYNHEDGVVVSETCAKKLTSMHAHQKQIPISASDVLDLKKYNAYFPASYTQETLTKYDDSGVIKQGERILPGEPLVIKMRKVEEDVTSRQLKQISRLLETDYRDASYLYDKDHAGVVSEVTRRGREVFIVIETEEKARIGDKVVARHGNKGTITMIVPDAKMPRDDEGNMIDIMVNPPGVPSRMNIAQVLEANASRIAEKEGKPYIARPSGENSTEKILKELKRHKLSDSRSIYDPDEDATIEGVTVGKEYFFKLEHQVEKKLSARGAGVDEVYSLSGQPSSGGGIGGRAVGLGEIYSLLAHGSNANLKDMFSFKGDQNPEYWRALEKGYPLPPPDQPASSKRLVGMLRAAGVNLEQRGNMAVMTPFLDRDIKKISNGEIKEPSILRASDLKEEKGGFFDLKLTGGLDGEKWTHIKLSEPMPHPTFEKAIEDLLKPYTSHLSNFSIDLVMAGKVGIKNGEIVEGEGIKGAKYGGEGLRAMLKQIDVDARLEKAQEEAKSAKGSDLNRLNREMRTLRNFRDNHVSPDEMVVSLVPVMPPKFRPISELPTGDLTIADVNEHYRALMLMNKQLDELKSRPSMFAQADQARSELLKGFRGVIGTSPGLVDKPNVKGITATIAGSQPKHGLYLRNTLRRRQDMSGTAVVEPEPALSMDEIGLPENMAWKIFEPLIKKDLRSMGLRREEIDKQLNDRGEIAHKSLTKLLEKHHVLANRAPTLHRLGFMSFKPKLVAGSALKLPVEVLSGFNADFDGDTFGVHVAVSEEANEEAKRMLPSANLYMPGKNREDMAAGLSQEFILGLYRISSPVKTTGKSYLNPEAVIRALDQREIKPSDLISVKGIGQITRTTGGLVIAMSKVPKELRDYQTPLTKKQVTKILVATEKAHGRKALIELMDHFKNLGRKWAYLTGSSILLSDMKSLSRERDMLYRKADMEALKIRSNPRLTKEQKDAELIKIYEKVDAKILTHVNKLPVNSSEQGRNNLSDMVVSGARGNPHQVKQIVGTLGLMVDHRQKTMSAPIRGNYIDGLSTRDFFGHSYSQRKGMIDKSQSVIGPGALSKEITNSATRYTITTKDCRTNQGRTEDVDKHLVDRVLNRAAGNLAKGTVLDMKDVEALKKKGVAQVFVRSPLTCEAPDGLCALCFGHDETGNLPEIGKNIGVSEIQAITERSVQLPMKSFHSGGVASAEGGLADAFSRAVQIMRLPDQIRGSAVLSVKTGRVDRVEKDALGRTKVVVSGQDHELPVGVRATVKVGDQVKMGDSLSTGVIKPQDVLALKDMTHVQTQIRDDLHSTFASADVKLHKRTYEVLVRSMTDQVRITDPGACNKYVVGDYATFSQVKAWNNQNPSKKQIKFEHELSGTLMSPKRTNDWAQRMALGGIQQTIREGAAMGYESEMKPGSFAWLSMGPGSQIRKPGEEFKSQTYNKRY